MKKKVLNLYRVSTKMQLHAGRDDIPMQKAECRRFIAAHSDWEYYGEIAEKGISGYKNTSEARDALNEITKRAGNREFDILLVYMSDRLGRREDDTPFFVAGLNRLGIEVWSVCEGQLKTEEHIDKLMNYIRFWQAEGESLKTSARVRDAQIEMLGRGEYTGGGCPYGYRQVYSGKCNNRGRALKKLEIYPEQAQIVKRIFLLSTEEGMGGYRIARRLNDENIPTQKESKWTLCTINNILRNPIYKGYYSYGKGKTKGKRGRTSPEEWIYSPVRHEELAIIEEAYWNRAQKVREARTPARFQKENAADTNYPARTNGQLLLMGLAYCGYCGSRLSNGTACDKWTTKDGALHKKIRRQYKCIAKSEGGSDCKGKFNYKKEQLDGAVLDAVSSYMQQLKPLDMQEQIKQERQAGWKREQRKLQHIKNRMETLERDITELKKRLPQVLNEDIDVGLSLTEFKTLIEEDKQKLEETKALFLEKQKELSSYTLNNNDMERLNTTVPAWEEFTRLSLPQQRILLSAIIQRIDVKRDSLEIRLRSELGVFLPPVNNSDASTSH